MGRQLDVRNAMFSKIWRRHFDTDEFRKRIGDLVSGSGGTVNDFPKMNTCALRLSYALLCAGLRMPSTRNSWMYRGRYGKALLPSLAAEYIKLLYGEKRIRNRHQIARQRGIIYFGGNFPTASGHVTLWDGSKCHFGDEYFRQPKIFFWKIAK